MNHKRFTDAGTIPHNNSFRFSLTNNKTQQRIIEQKKKNKQQKHK